MTIAETFSCAAHWAAKECGRAHTFIAAIMIILAWVACGPVLGFTDTWQLIINTGTTIVTFLMVFLIQNTQNRDTEAVQLKLDELIRTNQDASNWMLKLEDLTEDDLKRLKQRFTAIANRSA